MDLKLVPLLHLIVLTTSLAEPKLKPKAPQVYEEVDETPLVPFQRITRQPSVPKRFHFFTAQIDQQRWRYYQQQQADLINRAKNKAFRRKLKTPTRKREIQDQNQLTQQTIYVVPELVNFGLNHAENLRLLHDSFGGIHQDDKDKERDIQALNALLGKTPTLQLEGLQQLLVPKDHKPITENVLDVANPQRQPNIKVEHAPPEYQEAVAQIHVLQAESQKRLKGQNFLALSEIEKGVNAVAQAQAQQAAALAEVEAQEALTHSQGVYGNLAQEKIVEENEQIYGGNKDDLQYASQYAFGYRVRDYHSGNNFGHEEISDGNTAKGHYHVLLPDGRLQNVQYWADETGFHAKVTYDKLAQH